MTKYSYRRKDFNDSVIFSLDFPGANPRDCYRIEEEEDSFVLQADRKRICSADQRSPHLAIAVSSHGPRDIVAVLSRDGKTIPFALADTRTHLAVPTR